MPEAGGSNIELANHLAEHEHSSKPGGRQYLRLPRPWFLPSSLLPPPGAAIRQRSGQDTRRSCTAERANFGFKPRELPPTPIRNACITPPPWSSG